MIGTASMNARASRWWGGSRTGVLAAALAVAMGTVACAPAPRDTATTPVADSIEGLVDAARAEGTLTWYTVLVRQAAERVAAEFTEKYGVDVEIVRLSPGDLQPRLSSEMQAGTSLADVYTDPALGFIESGIGNGWFLPLKDASLAGGFPPAGYPERFVKDGGQVATVGLAALGIAFNTDHVSAVPTWETLIDPRNTSHVAFSDARADPATGFAFLDFLQQAFGDDYLRKLGDLQPANYSGGVATIQAIAAGEQWLYPKAAGQVYQPLKQQGAPLGFTVPTPALAAEQYVTLVAKPVHPNAARLFVLFVLGEEGGAAWNQGEGEYSVYAPEAATFALTRPESRDETRRHELAKLVNIPYP
jgi:iron(III) transport system substrate-binding protein